jgi:hypothetical protein
MTTQPQPDSAHLRAAIEIAEEVTHHNWKDTDARNTEVARRTFVISRLLSAHFPAPPALTGGDAKLVEELTESADWINEAHTRHVGYFHAETLRQSAQRITALSAQVAELSARFETCSKDSDNFRESEDYHAMCDRLWIEAGKRGIHKSDGRPVDVMLTDRIAELERDKAILDWMEEWHLSLSRLTSPDMGGIRFVGQAFNPVKARGEAGPSYVRIQGQTIRETVRAAMNPNR